MDVTVFVIDIGPSMAEKGTGRSLSNLDWSLKYVWDKIGAKMLTGRKGEVAGVVGFRTDGTDNVLGKDDAYKHITVLSPIVQMSTPNIQQLKASLVPSNTDEGDAISALVIGIDMIGNYCGTRRGKKELILITDGKGVNDFDSVSSIAGQIDSSGIELSVLGADFDDEEYGFKEEGKDENKRQNEEELLNFCGQCSGTYATMKEAIDSIAAMPRLKHVKPTPTFRGTLTIGDPENYADAVQISVERYPLIKIAKPPSASNYSVPAELMDAHATQQNGQDSAYPAPTYGVKFERTYIVQDEVNTELSKEVPQAELERGYTYGRTVIPLSKADEDIIHFETKQGLDILGFVKTDRYKRFLSMSETSLIVGQKVNEKASIALSSLIHSLHECEAYALGRLVKKDGKPPTLILMAPKIEPDFECLIDVEVPFTEDIRLYNFAPLDRVTTIKGKVLDKHRNLPTEEMDEAMSAFVDSMDLTTVEYNTTGGPVDLIKPEDTYNAVVYRINQALIHRAVHPGAKLPPIPESILKYSKPVPEIANRMEGPLKALERACDIKRVPPRVIGKRRRDAEPELKPAPGLDLEDLLFQKPKVETPSTQPEVTTISQEDPVRDFEAMLRSEKPGVLEKAFAQMRAIIPTVIAAGEDDKALNALHTFRKNAEELEEVDLYNEFIYELKPSIFRGELGDDRSSFWGKLVDARLGLVSKFERKDSSISVEEAEQFHKSN
ncbi:ATP-dependent DNA helicase yku80 [Saitoella coloradoensis]